MSRAFEIIHTILTFERQKTKNSDITKYIAIPPFSLELLSRIELETSSLPRMRSTD